MSDYTEASQLKAQLTDLINEVIEHNPLVKSAIKARVAFVQSVDTANKKVTVKFPFDKTELALPYNPQMESYLTTEPIVNKVVSVWYNQTIQNAIVMQDGAWQESGGGSGSGSTVEPSNTTPLMDGTASVGTETKYAHGDHRHPTDTTRQAALTATQQNAVDSGITSTLVGQIGTNKTAIANEVTNRTNADNALQTAIDGKVSKSGDTMSGGLNLPILVVNPSAGSYNEGVRINGAIGGIGWCGVYMGGDANTTSGWDNKMVYVARPSGKDFLVLGGAPYAEDDANRARIMKTGEIYEKGQRVYSPNNQPNDIYILKETVIDATSSIYDRNTYYPVTFYSIPTDRRACIKVEVALNNSGIPSWATHSEGFACRFVEEVNGNGWGGMPIERQIFIATYLFCDKNPIGGVDQMTQSSTEVIWVRGGGRYTFKYSYFLDTPELHSSAYTINRGYDGSGNPYNQTAQLKTTPDNFTLSLTQFDGGTQSISGQKQFVAPLTFFSTSTNRGTGGAGAGIANGVLPIGWNSPSSGTAQYNDINNNLSNGGFSLSQGQAESSGIFFSGDHIAMWSPCDTDPIRYYDEDNGNLVFAITNSATISSSSDERFKEDIIDFTVDDESFLAIKPKSFNFKKSRTRLATLQGDLERLATDGLTDELAKKYACNLPTDTDEAHEHTYECVKENITKKIAKYEDIIRKKSLGVIAQELETIYPQLVSDDGTDEKYRNVDYTQLHIVTLAKVQDLLKRVKALENNHNGG